MTELHVCTCGIVENAYHFFYVCIRYDIQRHELLDSLFNISNLNHLISHSIHLRKSELLQLVN